MSGFYQTTGPAAPSRPQAEPAIPYLPTNTGEVDGLVRDLLAIMQQMALMARPTMGTVLEVNGGEVVVHLDDERIPRTVGFARTKGIQYAPGDRVKVSLLRNDEYVVDGLADSSPTDRTVHRGQIAVDAVGGEELADGIVSFAHLTSALSARITASITSIPPIAAKSITRDMIANGAIGPDQIAENAVGGWQLAENAVSRSNINPGAIGAESFGEGVINWLRTQLAGATGGGGGAGGGGNKKKKHN